MDLSGLKWPIIIVVIVGIGWLGSSSGVNFMFKKFTEGAVGEDVKKDETNEAGLSRLGGWCLRLFKYKKALNILETAVQRYPEGKNRFHNEYRMVKCAEKLKQYKRASGLLYRLISANASQIDSRVPQNDVLILRREKLVETHELEAR